MNYCRISKSNATFQELLALKTNRKKRAKTKTFFVEGVQSINNAISSNWEIEALFFVEMDKLSNWAKGIVSKVNCRKYIVTDDLMKQASEKDDFSEIMAVIKMKEFSIDIDSEKPVILLLDRPSNKGNLGTIIRSAEALGVDLILYSGHSVDIYDPRIIVSSMGSFFKVPFYFIDSNSRFEAIVDMLKSKYSIKLVGTSLQTDSYIHDADMKPPIMLLIGNEADGLNNYYRECCDEFVKIKMRPNIDSLNIACATSICLYEISKCRPLE